MNFFLIFNYLLIGFLLSSCSSINEDNHDRAWIQINHKGENELRVITKKDTCPMVNIDGQLQPMETRAPYDSTSYPFLVCKKTLPKSYAKVSVNDQQFRSSSPSIHKIAIIGDTGCRDERANTRCRDAQDINNLEEWPFPQIVNNISQHHPDLVIHLGDYTYRKDPKCAIISEKQDVWARWREELFDPADTLLRQTPWVFLRGNVEFKRTEEGWYRLISPYPYTSHHVTHEEPFWIDSIEDVRLLVHDSAGLTKETIAFYKTQIHKIHFHNDKKSVWLLTHKPLFGIFNIQQNENSAQELIFSDQSAPLDTFTEVYEKIRLILSGHIHSFQFIKPVQAPEQFVIGNGGGNLEKFTVPAILENTIIKSKIIEKGLTLTQFGYGILERNKDSWLFSLYSVKNHILVSCVIEKTKSRCEFKN